MSLVAAPGGSGGGRKRPRCLGGPAFGCDCEDCRAWRRREVDALTQRRIARRKKLGEKEGLHPDNDDFAETEAISLGRVPPPDPEVDPDWEDDEDGDDD